MDKDIEKAVRLDNPWAQVIMTVWTALLVLFGFVLLIVFVAEITP